MSTDVRIIDVNLGVDVAEMVQDEVMQTTAVTEQAIASAVADRQRIDKLREKKVKVDWESWFVKFTEKPEGFTKTELIEAGQANVGSFIANFKAFLRRHKENKQDLVFKDDRYSLVAKDPTA